MNKKGVLVKDAKILILGFTFKENCPDIRNTKVIDIYTTLQEYTHHITVCDPRADIETVKEKYHIHITKILPRHKYDVVILAVAHDEFKETDLTDLLSENAVVYDVKGVMPVHLIDGRL
jgi:UDP-N-acetyl-D-galactosamine dehydrogenase